MVLNCHERGHTPFRAVKLYFWEAENAESLIPRKPTLETRPGKGFNEGIPYSLGKPIEWKCEGFSAIANPANQFPTR